MTRTSSLFRVKELVADTAPVISAAVAEDGSVQEFLLCKGSAKLQELFPTLEQNRCLHYVSNGDWSTHELVMHLLELIGPAELYFTTWSLKEYPVRLFLDAMESGKITHLYALLDSRVKVRNPDVFQLAKHNFSKVRQYDCHAKVSVLINDKWVVSIVGSANMTNNPRVEACMLSTNQEVGHFHKNWILELINNGHPLD